MSVVARLVSFIGKHVLLGAPAGGNGNGNDTDSGPDDNNDDDNNDDDNNKANAGGEEPVLPQTNTADIDKGFPPRSHRSAPDPIRGASGVCRLSVRSFVLTDVQSAISTVYTLTPQWT